MTREETDPSTVERASAPTSTSPASSTPDASTTIAPPAMETKWRFLDGKFKNARGQWLYYCSYFPHDTTALRGVVLFLHGIGEYARRFTDLFDVLCTSGFGVVAYDMIAHSRSDDDEKGQRAHAQQFQHFINDINIF